MTDPLGFLVFSIFSVLASALVSIFALKIWRGWLEIKRLELGSAGHSRAGSSSAARVEFGDLKERVRKLEAIASGIDF